MGWTRRAASALAGLALATTLAPLAASPAGGVANPAINVTTTADEVNPSDGVVSLREAVDLANSTPGPDTIQLVAGASYLLTICTPGDNQEDLNASGDLDARDSAGLTLLGAGATVIQTCKGVAGTQAAERVLEATAGPLALVDLRLSGGRGYDGAIALKAAGGLGLDTVTITDSANPNDRAGISVGREPAAVEALSSATLSQVVISGTSGGAGVAFVSTNPAATVSITGSTISGNVAPGALAGGVIDDRDSRAAPMSLASSTVTHNVTVEGTVQGTAGGIFLGVGGVVSATTMDENVGFYGGGMVAGPPTTIDGSSIDHNRALQVGGGVGSAGIGVTMTNTEIVGNQAGFGAGGLYGAAHISHSAIVGNSAVWHGGGFWLENVSSGPALELDLSDTTVASNTAYRGGGVVVDSDQGPTPPVVHLTHVTMVDDTATTFGNGNEIAASGTAAASIGIDATASTIGRAASPGPTCALDYGALASGGYTFTADSSCGSLGGATDLPSAGDPTLVGNPNGFEPPLSYTPGFGSPLHGAIPSADPLCSGTDQLGHQRPVTPSATCDIGSVEAGASPAFTSDGSYTPLTPARVLDTRTGLGGVPMLRGGAVQQFRIGGVGGVPANARAVVLNLTATDASAPTYVTAFPGGVANAPLASSLNVRPGQTVPNLVTVKVGKDGMVALLAGAGTVDLVADVVGYFAPDYPTRGELATVSPTRVIDTRPGAGHLGLTTFATGETQSMVIPAAPAQATSVVLNVTVTNPTAAGFLTIFPTATAPNHPPGSSSLNFTPGETVANLVVTQLGVGGSVSFFNSFGSTDVVVDVVGWYTTDPSATLSFTSVSPRRLADSRLPGSPLTRVGPGTHQDLLVADGVQVPADAKAVLLNVTAVDAAGAGYLTVYPTGAPPNPPPLASNLNFLAGQIVPNAVLATLSADGHLSIFNGSGTGAVDVVVDLVGWYR